MNIDISKVNLTERDIEDWLYENPQVVGTNGKRCVKRWLGRQYSLPSGIADLIGVMPDDGLAVVEVKNVPINKAAILQVCRYASDIESIASYALQGGFAFTQRFLIGPSIDDQTFLEAMACEVHIITFRADIKLSLAVSGWSKAYEEKREEEWARIAGGSEWDEYIKEIWTKAEERAKDETPRRRYSLDEIEKAAIERKYSVDEPKDIDDELRDIIISSDEEANDGDEVAP